MIPKLFLVFDVSLVVGSNISEFCLLTISKCFSFEFSDDCFLIPDNNLSTWLIKRLYAVLGFFSEKMFSLGVFSKIEVKKSVSLGVLSSYFF